MLWRVQATFRNPLSLKMSYYTMYIFLIFIHLWLIFALIITIFLTPSKVNLSGNNTHCIIYIKKITNNLFTPLNI